MNWTRRLLLALWVTTALSSAGLAGAQELEAEAGGLSITGVVIDQDSSPIAKAELLMDGQRTRPTNSQGTFRVDSLRPGNHTLEVRALGFIAVRTRLELLAGQNRRMVIRLQRRAQQLPEVVATSRQPRLDRVGYYRRQEAERARFVERDSLLALDSTDLVLALSRLPGFSLVPAFGTPDRGVRSMACREGFELWVNGHQVDSVDAAFYLRTLHPTDLDGVEIYEDGFAPLVFTRHWVRGCVVAMWEREEEAR